MKLEERCRRISIILSDVDGVLTDGSLFIDTAGVQTLRFYIRDGYGICLWKKFGGEFGLVTGNQTDAVRLRAEKLGIEILRQGTLDKLPAVEEILKAAGKTMDELCFIGDDLPDLPVIQAAGLGIAVADAVDEVHEAANFTTTQPGGRGAVREAIEMIMKHSETWKEAVTTVL